MALKVVTAPEKVFYGPHVFLAGGISNCPDWQQDAIEMFSDYPMMTVVNPRRPVGILSDNDEARAQIEWEFNALHKVQATLFWFPEETLCPITLFELGVALGENRKVAVGTHPNYGRRFDVIEQVVLFNERNGTGIRVRDSLEDVVLDTKGMFRLGIA